MRYSETTQHTSDFLKTSKYGNKTLRTQGPHLEPNAKTNESWKKFSKLNFSTVHKSEDSLENESYVYG